MKTLAVKSLFNNKVTGIQASNFIKKRLHRKCFPVKFVKFLRTPILKNIYERLLLKIFSKTLSMSRSHSYSTENEWNHLAVFRFIFNLFLKKNTLAGLSKHLRQKPLKEKVTSSSMLVISQENETEPNIFDN